MKIDGACHCGFVTFEAEAELDKAAICHCTDCQTLSGSAFRTVLFTTPGSFKLRSGTLKTYVKTGESGTKRPQGFCPECGTPIYSTTLADDPKVYSIRLGTVRQRAQFVPSIQLWSRSAQHWLGGLNAIAREDTQPAFNAAGGTERR